MITDLLMSSIVLTLLVVGVKSPVFALMAVLWVDIVKPQNLSYSFLAGKPLSLIVTAFFFISIISNQKKLAKLHKKSFFLFMLVFSIWITVATVRAQFPELAWMKYDVVIKTFLFIFFIPLALRDRKDFELFIAVVTISFSLFITMSGVKSLLGGGGYGVALIGSGGFMYAEGSTLATLSMSLMPLFLYMYRHSEFRDSHKFIKYFYIFFSFCAILTLVGTQARTGLVALVVLVFIHLFYSKKKLRDVVLILLCAILLSPYFSEEWKSRMSSIDSGTTTEASALGRIVVWRWTIDYVAESPFFGGGFYAYNANAGQLHFYQKEDEIAIIQNTGKAFHSIFFEVLGETGYGGLFIFILIIAHALLLNRQVFKLKSANTGAWQYNMAKAINTSLIVYCAGGLFIGVAFYPWMYYLYALSASLNNFTTKGYA